MAHVAQSDGDGLRIGVIGAGKMAGTLVRGWAKAGAVRPQSVQIINRRRETAEALAQETGVRVAPTLADVVQNADLLLLGVKPWQIAPVLQSVSGLLPPSCLVVSLAAGVSCAALQDLLAPNTPLIRAMPNTPALVGAGATAFCRGEWAMDAHAQRMQSLFGAVGVVVEVTEAQINGVIGVAGSGVAYFYLLIEALIDGGVRVGLPRDISRALAVQTVLGAARMVGETGQHPAVLKDAVTTPGGTTIAALDVLESAGVRGTLIAAVRAAHDRARDM